MSDQRPPWQDELRTVKSSLESLERRVRLLEGHSPSAVEADVSPSADDSEFAEAVRAGIAKAPAYAGRLLLVLGGAYLLRAVTEVEHVPGIVGALVGFGYGLAWLLLADRAGARGDTYAATWHGGASALIVFPLLWETAFRFGALPVVLAAALLGLSAIAALWIAARHGLPTLAALFASSAGVCGIALMVSAPGAALPAMVALLASGLAAWFLAPGRETTVSVGVAAAAADLAGCVLLVGAKRGSGAEPWAATLLLLILFSAYVICIAAGSIAGRRRLDAFGWVQTALVSVVGFGGALFLAHGEPMRGVAIGVGAVAVGVALYLLAFTVLDRERRRCFQYLTSLAIAMLLVASASVLPRPVLPWTLLAVGTALMARRFGRVTLGVHASMYALAATLASGVLVDVYATWTSATHLMPARLDEWLAAAALVVVAALPVQSTRAETARTGHVMRAMMLVFAVAVTSALALSVGGSVLPAAREGGDAGWLVALRTVLLSGYTIALGALARLEPYRFGARLVPVLLGGGALKLMLEDVALGKPVTLALSFSAFGAALILAPRLLRRRSLGA